MLDDDSLLGTIERYGWALQYVQHDDPRWSYAYTVGLHRHGLPEVVVAGLPPDQSWPVLNDVAGRSTSRPNPVQPGAVLIDVVAGYALHVASLDDTDALTRARAVAGTGTDLRAVQLIPEPVLPGHA